MKEYGVLNSWTKESILASHIPVSPTNRQVVLPIVSWRNGEIIMSGGCGRLISYCPVKKRSPEIRFDVDDDKLFTAVPHIPSFASPMSAARKGYFRRVKHSFLLNFE